MELNYITFFQENLASFFDFEFIQKKGVPEANQPDNFYKGRKKRQLAINLLEKDYIQVTTSQSTPKVSL